MVATSLQPELTSTETVDPWTSMPSASGVAAQDRSTGTLVTSETWADSDRPSSKGELHPQDLAGHPEQIGVRIVC